MTSRLGKRMALSTKYLIGLLFASTLVVACNSRHLPAPVVSLDTNITKRNNLTEISGESYIVQRGDTLFAVAFYSGNDYRDIARYNNISAPYNIFPGQKLRLIAAPAKNNHIKNKVIAKSAEQSTKVVVDPIKPQAYGGSKSDAHRKKSKNSSKTSSKPDNRVSDSQSSSWIWPAKGRSASAVVGSDGTNRGVDIKGELSSPIYAAASGKVVYAGNALKGYGNLIIVKHDNNLLSAYAHNDTILVGEQTYVTQGQKIATMGRADNSEVMLHFEIRRKGKSLDPYSFLPPQ
jgi:lipoprotein NlpD